jgi:hypothetical protein
MFSESTCSGVSEDSNQNFLGKRASGHFKIKFFKIVRSQKKFFIGTKRSKFECIISNLNLANAAYQVPNYKKIWKMILL